MSGPVAGHSENMKAGETRPFAFIKPQGLIGETTRGRRGPPFSCHSDCGTETSLPAHPRIIHLGLETETSRGDARTSTGLMANRANRANKANKANRANSSASVRGMTETYPWLFFRARERDGCRLSESSREEADDVGPDRGSDAGIGTDSGLGAAYCDTPSEARGCALS